MAISRSFFSSNNNRYLLAGMFLTLMLPLLLAVISQRQAFKSQAAPIATGFEAENGTLTNGASKIVLSGASAGFVVQFSQAQLPANPPATGCPVDNPSVNSATQTVSILDAGTYRVWVRIAVQDAQNTASMIKIDNSCFVVADEASMPVNQLWWVDYQNGNQVSKIDVNLTAGTHTLTLMGYEAGVSIDKVLFVPDDCTPSGDGSNCINRPLPTSPIATPTDITRIGITPTFGVIAPCPSCVDPTNAPTITGSAPQPSTTLSAAPSEPPCETGASIADHKKKKSKHKNQKGGVSSFMEAILEFFMQLLLLLLQLLGAGGPGPNPNPNPTPSDGPNPTSGNPNPTSGNPNPTTGGSGTSPTTNPCPPTGQPTSPVQPTVTQPMVSPSTTVPTTAGPSSAAPTIPISSVPSTTNAEFPAQVLNLANWKVTLPIGSSESPTEIKQPQLATYKLDPWFIVNPGGGVRFRAPVSAVTTGGSNYPRSELREMTNNGSTNAAWSSGTGTHTMTIDQAITAVPQTKKHVVAGQIHDGSDDVIVIRLEGTKLFIDIGGTDGPTLDANYTLGKRFTVKFEVNNNQTKIYYNGSTTPSHTLSKSYSGAYFKAGAYTQSNCTTESSSGCVDSNYGEVVIYNVQVTHN